ncbi:MAG: STAS domain-containing protein [Cellulomonas sp.]|nr:STAS domain-containing protein [Cellulomonas sp.]
MLFFATVLTDMPTSLLGAIVFLISRDLVDVRGLRRIARHRRSEFVIALVTAIVVCVIGVEQGIILSIVVWLLQVIRRRYQPKDSVVSVSPSDQEAFVVAGPRSQGAPGLIVFRDDSDLSYANANRVIDDVEQLIDTAPGPVRWLILDAKSIDDINYSAGVAISGLLDFLAARKVTFAICGADTALVDTLRAYDRADRIGAERRWESLADAISAVRSDRVPAPDEPG